MGSGITLKYNEIKDTIKVHMSLDYRETLLKRTTKKTNIQREVFLCFHRPLMLAGLPLIKNVLKSLAKGFLIRLELKAAASATDAAI